MLLSVLDIPNLGRSKRITGTLNVDMAEPILESANEDMTLMTVV